jgi:hypothetical protein
MNQSWQILFLFDLSSSFALHRRNNGLPINWPFPCMSPTLLLNLHQLQKKVAEILERSKGTLSLKGIWFANMDMLVTSDPANVHNNNKKLLELSQTIRPSPSSILGNMLFNIDFKEWTCHRRIIHAPAVSKTLHEGPA